MAPWLKYNTCDFWFGNNCSFSSVLEEAVCDTSCFVDNIYLNEEPQGNGMRNIEMRNDYPLIANQEVMMEQSVFVPSATVPTDEPAINNVPSQDPLGQWPPTFWAPGTCSVEIGFSTDWRGVWFCVLPTSWRGLCLFAWPGFWHATDWYRSTERVGDSCSRLVKEFSVGSWRQLIKISEQQ